MWKNYLLWFFNSGMLSIASFAHAQGSGEYPNPINFKDIPSFILYLAGAVVKIAIPVAVLLVIFIGFKFIASSAQGDTAGIAKSRKLLLWTLLGTAIVVGAAALAYGFINFVRTV